MANLDVPAAYLASAPVIVTSPTTRCGTTLVQRLISASDNAFVYGEEVGNQMCVLTRLFSTQILAAEQNAADVDTAFWRAMDGTLDEWRPGLAPPAHVTLRAWTDIYYQLPLSLAKFGRSIGRPIWGFKWPGCSIEALKTFLTLMPQSKIVYVVRDLEDALKSAKARRFVTTQAQVLDFCTTWTSNLKAIADLKQNDRVMMLRYETLVERRHEQLAALQAFTGASNIRMTEFDLRLNTFVGAPDDGHALDGYIPPEPLDEVEREILRSYSFPSSEGLAVG
jgi:hypothetical protein